MRPEAAHGSPSERRLPHAAEALELLRCPACNQRLIAAPAVFRCVHCAAVYPVIDGIPRFVVTPEDDAARRTQASFAYEWSQFHDWTSSGHANFIQYFGDLDVNGLGGFDVLDAGCGMGRHARQIAQYARRVVAMDFSRAIEYASRNANGLGNVWCIQGDIMAPPLADGAFDFVYSLGVLHHIADTESAARRLVAKVKPGGRFRLYLYWKREGLAGAILGGVSLVRRVTTRLPFPLLKGLCWVLSVLLFAGLILPYRVLGALGTRRVGGWPLGVYARYPFRILFNDQFDRFSAPIEQRWTRDEVEHLLKRLGLERLSVSPAFGWIGEGWKPRIDAGQKRNSGVSEISDSMV